MSSFGDEVGLLWVADSAASAANFVRGTANEHVENPFALAVEETTKELDRLRRRRASLEAQLSAIADEEQRLVAKLEAQQQAIAKYEETGEIDSRLVPECKAAIKRELNADSRELLNAADLQEVPRLRGAVKQLGWEFASQKADNEFVYVTLKRKREEVAPMPKAPTRESLRKNIAKAIARFRAPDFDRSRVVVATRNVITEALTPLQPAAP